MNISDCNDYTWGQNCTKHCGCDDSAEVCRKNDGACLTSGCPPYVTGVGCDTGNHEFNTTYNACDLTI